MVLAPELATLLIMEDMNVESERARAIIGESNLIGDLLNPAVKGINGDIFLGEAQRRGSGGNSSETVEAAG